MTDVADVTTMTVGVQVLVVDGTRRMSHKFYEQIPRLGVLNPDGTIKSDQYRIWGWTSVCRCDYHCLEIVWSCGDDAIYRAHYTSMGVHWNSDGHLDDWDMTNHSITSNHPQLYVGG